MNVYQIICCFYSTFFNSILLILIATKSPKNLGFYKYLMIYISMFEIFYSVWDTIVDPTVHFHTNVFVVFRPVDSWFPREIGFHLISAYCGCFGFSLAIFGVHFVYRYGAIEKDFHLKYMSGRKVYILMVVPFLYGVWWAVLCSLFLNYDNESDDYMEESMQSNFELNVKSVSYIFILYHIPNGDGTTHPNIKTFVTILCMWFMVLSSLYCVFYFGIRCYFKITKSLEETIFVSKLTKSLQQQLFTALVVQTLIPLVLMYIPIAVLFLVPMLKLNLGFNSTFVGYTIALYPAIDPLPNILIIKQFRNAIFSCIGVFIQLPMGVNRSNTVDSSTRNARLQQPNTL